MEVDKFELTEDFVLKLTGQKKLSLVKELNVSGQEIEEISRSLLEKMLILEKLDVSNNKLENFPSRVTLRNLKYLNVSNNALSSAQFASQFPNLETLYISGNNINQSDKHIIVESCLRLLSIDDHLVDSVQNLNDRLKEKLQTQVNTVWEDDFSDSYTHGVPIEKVHVISEKICSKVKASDKKTSSMTEARDFLLKKVTDELICHVQSGNGSPSKRARLSQNSPSVHSPSSHKPVTPIRKTYKRPPAAKLPDVSDYDPVTFLRCHFGDRMARKQGCRDNDPTDEFTKIWQCAFEPDPYNPAKDTGRVATCGGHTVNLIDCSTGKIMKKYKHPGEQFYSIAWTTLTLTTEHGEKQTNVLAVGGYDACLKLINPEQFVCYKEWGSGLPNKSVSRGAYYISDMTFHPQNKTWLFAGTSDTTITLWDIGIPSGPKHETTVRKLSVFHCDSEILHLIISIRTNHLVASTMDQLKAWTLPTNDVQTQRQAKRFPNVELEVPCDQIEADGLTLLTDDIVACKCVGNSNIFIWSLTKTLGKVKSKQVKIKPLCNLQWKLTEEEFINIGAGNGLVACGDDVGNIRIYNVRSLLQQKKLEEPEVTYAPSLELEWPECDLDKKAEQDKQMKDILDKPELLIVNDISISHSGEYLVGVTDNNLVCIWRAVDNTS